MKQLVAMITELVIEEIRKEQRRQKLHFCYVPGERIDFYKSVNVNEVIDRVLDQLEDDQV